MINTLEERTTRVALKGEAFTVHAPASKDEIKALEMETIQELDPAIKFGSLQQKDPANCKRLETYTKNDCCLRKYTFQI